MVQNGFHNAGSKQKSSSYCAIPPRRVSGVSRRDSRHRIGYRFTLVGECLDVLDKYWTCRSAWRIAANVRIDAPAGRARASAPQRLTC